MLHAKVGKKGQIVIPYELRKKYGIKCSDTIIITDDQQGNIILAVKPTDPTQAMRGALKGLWKEDAQEYICKLRQEDRE
ncbi:AbrB/MazE/SpoVT family DNA-binding domain-containing protein [Sporolituus thermophilus]|uniref:Looped-hinge helix DNA binding domain-containing protein, AbrB family n=1 Tax=Sporolituus thermophilus DSM 23256 TaxID=1123285 RepID=A0A1G7P1L2_9FIRM|nr:AbrB/MazE/SpoVT family DNA-binding domain-containing protein [Sporolituus thermophilus]SDF79310.1 looped-hinge helix DNA binding domain-containing protein, AbrB family [Sporolituus thermophilus DSM 23256]